MSTCCSLNCRLINYCAKYNNNVDRGVKCEVFEDIEYLIEKTKAEQKASAEAKRRKQKADLEARAETLQNVFYSLKMDDVKITVKRLPGKDYHLCAKDAQGNFWKDGDIYKFVINDCLGWNPDGSLQYGYGHENAEIRRMCKDAEKYYGVKKDGVR